MHVEPSFPVEKTAFFLYTNPLLWQKKESDQKIIILELTILLESLVCVGLCVCLLSSFTRKPTAGSLVVLVSSFSARLTLTLSPGPWHWQGYVVV